MHELFDIQVVTVMEASIVNNTSTVKRTMASLFPCQTLSAK